MDNLIYHYTDLNALDGIIQADKVLIRATRYGFLNDPFEKIWAEKGIKKLIKQDLAGTNHSEDLVNKLVDRHPYIISFCDIPDYRNMWRLYCNDGIGVCIGIDACILNEIANNNRNEDPALKQDYFESVYYCSRKNIDDAISFWKNKGIFNLNTNDELDNLYAISAFIKCDDFDVENEVRYVRLRENKEIKVSPPAEIGTIKSTPTEDKREVKYRLRGLNEVVPYIEVEFPSQVIKRIIVGYAYPDKEMATQYVKQILSKNKLLAKVDVEYSKLKDIEQ